MNQPSESITLLGQQVEPLDMFNIFSAQTGYQLTRYEQARGRSAIVPAVLVPCDVVISKDSEPYLWQERQRAPELLALQTSSDRTLVLNVLIRPDVLNKIDEKPGQQVADVCRAYAAITLPYQTINMRQIPPERIQRDIVESVINYLTPLAE